MNVSPTALRFSSGSVMPFSALKNGFGGVHDAGVHEAEYFPDPVRLTLAHQACVHIDRHQPVAERPVRQDSADGTVHAARQGDQCLSVFDPAPDTCNGLLDKRIRIHHV